MRLITGQYEGRIDEKGRMHIPKGIRFSRNYYAGIEGKFIVLYLEELYKKLAKKFLERNVFDEGRINFANAIELKVDKEGRVNIGKVSDMHDKRINIKGNLDCILISKK